MNKKDISEWLINYLSDLVEIPANEIDTNKQFQNYGIDSTGSVGLAGDLSQWLNKKVEIQEIYKYPTIDALVNYIIHKN